MAFVAKFELAERIACKASIMIEGLAGSGKSGLALMLAYALAGGFKPENQTPEKQKEIWKTVFAIDTENKSLNLLEHKKIRLQAEENINSHNQRELNLRISTLKACEPA